MCWSGDTPQQIRCYAVAADFLKTFGIAPVVGRDFSPDDDRPRAPTVVLLSYGFWHRAFGGDVKALGKTITLERRARASGRRPSQRV